MSAINPLLKENEMGLMDLLPEELWTSALSYLPFNGQICFDRANRAYHAVASEEAWRQRRLVERYSFEWKMAGKSQRSNYCLSKALTLFVEKFSDGANSVPIAMRTYNKYKGLAAQFPLFGFYVQWRLLKQISTINLLKTNESKREEIFLVGNEGYGGESLLHALFECRLNKSQENVVEWLRIAIQQGATLAATWGFDPHIGYRDSSPFIKTDAERAKDDQFRMSLALEAVEKGDPIPFENLVAKLTPARLFALGKHYSGQASRADRIFTTLLTDRNKILPDFSEMLESAALAKARLHQNKEADELYARFFIAYGKSGREVSAYTLANAALVKSFLKQDLLADELYTKALVAYEKLGEEPRSDVLANFALVKMRLKQYENADEFYTKALIAYKKEGLEPPAVVLGNAGFVKMQLKQDEQGYELYSKAAIAAEDKTRSDVLKWMEMHKSLQLKK